VFKIKHRGSPIDEKDLHPKQFKARVVIRGQYMKEGLDYNGTFAPVAKPATLRAVLPLATKNEAESSSTEDTLMRLVWSISLH